MELSILSTSICQSRNQGDDACSTIAHETLTELLELKLAAEDTPWPLEVVRMYPAEAQSHTHNADAAVAAGAAEDIDCWQENGGTGYTKNGFVGVYRAGVKDIDLPMQLDASEV